MKHVNVNIVCYSVLLLCIIVISLVYWGSGKINDLKTELETLTIEHNALNNETDMMIQRKQAFLNAFSELEKLKVGVGANVDFYSEAQQAIRRGGARVLSNAPNPPRDGRISMRMTFTGDYYAIIRAFAELRGLPNVVRVVTVNLASTNPDTSVISEMRAEVLLEAVSNR